MTREELERMPEFIRGKASTEYYNKHPKANPIDAFEAGWDARGKQSPWISVQERLPEKEKDCENTSIMVAVVCARNPNRWYPAEYWYDEKRWFCCEQNVSTDYLDDVTHWMPIPLFLPLKGGDLQDSQCLIPSPSII